MKNDKLIFLKVFIACVSIFFASFSCNKNVKDKYHCNDNTTIIRTVSNEKGKFIYLNEQQVYALSISSGIDNVDYYIVCNLSSNNYTLNDSLTFSGNVRSSTIQSKAGGEKYYELELTNLK